MENELGVTQVEARKRQRRELFDQIRDLQREANLEADEAERLAAEALVAARAHSQGQRAVNAQFED